MVFKLETTDFRLKNAERPYLNRHFGAESVLLPYAYGRGPCDQGAVSGGVEGDAVWYEDRPLYRRRALQLRVEVLERAVRH